MAYSAVPDSDLDAESGGKYTVFQQLNYNIDALYEDTRAEAYKSSNEAVSSSTTLQDDDDLTFTAGANEVWVVKFVLLVTTSDATGDLKLQVTTPGGGSTGYVIVLAHNNGSVVSAYGAIDSAIAINYTAARTSDPCHVSAYVSTVTSGTVKLQWAQNAASGTTTLLAGSFMDAFRSDDL